MDRIKLILVDNDPDELYFMEKGFKSLPSYEILGKFSDAAALMEFLYDARRLPDLVITDLNMPGKSGIEIAREITLNPNFAYIKVIVLSLGFGSNSFDTKRSGRSGSPFFVPKPSSLEYKSFATELYDKILTDLIQR
ncbi:MAG TPA: response regulator [Chryseolinea sp.]|nr:response regulator [Chryseolinea sp.]